MQIVGMIVRMDVVLVKAEDKKRAQLPHSASASKKPIPHHPQYRTACRPPPQHDPEGHRASPPPRTNTEASVTPPPPPLPDP
jgi:hypothetical protein